MRTSIRSVALMLGLLAAWAPPPARAQGGGAPPIQIVQGRNFTYALPAGWRTVEEGNHALVLQSADQGVGIIVFGTSGFQQGLSPFQYAQYVITQRMKLAPDARVFDAAAIQPFPGYTSAAVMNLTMTGVTPQGRVPIVGMAISNVVSVYGRSDAFVTVMLARATHWPAVRGWLPQVAMQALNTGPNPFGRTGMSASIQQNTQRVGQTYQQYLQWSRQNWAEVVAQRAQSLDRQAQAVGENLTGQYWSRNPYTGNPERYSTTPGATWVNRDGRVMESANPTFDPRTPTDNDWRRVQR